MADDDKSADRSALLRKAPKAGGASNRADRLATALRANLHKRKEALREREKPEFGSLPSIQADHDPMD